MYRLPELRTLDIMLEEYYALMGWGTDGVPTQERLQSLGLEAEGSKTQHSGVKGGMEK